MELKRLDNKIEAYDGDQAMGEITFIREENYWDADHTFIEKEYRGRDLGTQLLDGLVQWAKEENTKIFPSCPYVVKKFDEEVDKYGSIDARK